MKNHPFPRLEEIEDATQAREGDEAALQHTLMAQTYVLLAVTQSVAEREHVSPRLRELLAELSNRFVLITKLHPSIDQKTLSAMLDAFQTDYAERK